jgi:glycosyltransferase involved in cell wall biosynthesis
VSVCLPTFQRSGLLAGCLRSILGQTFTDFEVIVSDNASTDDTEAVARSFADDRVRYRRNDRNIGPFPNMNHAISLARGDLVVVAHDDDLYLPEFLEREVAIMRSDERVGMVHSAVYQIDAAGRRERVVRAYPRTRVLPGRAAFVRFLRGHDVCCSSVMVRRRLYDEAGTFDPRFKTADFELWLRLALRGDVGYVARPLVEMRVHAERGTSEVTPERWYDEFVEIMEEGIVLAGRADPPLVVAPDRIRRDAARAQGRRFLIAALAASANGDVGLARGYARVVRQFGDLGLAWPYVALAWMASSPAARVVLAPAATLRRATAKRRL